MNSVQSNAVLPALGFPIRTSPDQRLVGNSPRLIAATHVLHRLLQPRHPSHALSSLVYPHSVRPQSGLAESRSRSRIASDDPRNLDLKVTSNSQVSYLS